MSAPDWLHDSRPVIEVIADKPTVWPAVGPGSHAGFMSIFASDASLHQGQSDFGLLGPDGVPAASQVPVWDLFGVEYVAPVKGLMLCPVLPSPIPDMTPDGISFGSPSYGSGQWRLVSTDLTQQAWWKCATPAGGNFVSDTMLMEPGAQVRVALYDPPASTAGNQFLRLSLCLPGATSPQWAQLCFPLASGQQGDGTGTGTPVTDRRAVAVSPSTHKTLAILPFGGVGSGQIVSLRLRIVQTNYAWLIVTGDGMGSGWYMRLPTWWTGGPPEARIKVETTSGMFAAHVGQCEYNKIGGNYAGTWDWNETTPAKQWPQVNPGTTTDTVVPWVPTGYPGGGDAYASAWGIGMAGMYGRRYSSPVLMGLSRWVPPLFLTASSSPTTLTQIDHIRLTVNRRRGHRCEVTSRNLDPAGTASLVLGGVATVKAQWSDDSALTTLFRGRVIQPHYSKQGPIPSKPSFALASDDILLAKKPMISMGGSWAGIPFDTAFHRLLNAAGVADGRITTCDAAASPKPVLLPSDPGALHFDPSTTIDRALDAICKCRGAIWWVDTQGNYRAGVEEASGGEPGVIDETSTAFRGWVHGLSHERSLDGNYANAVAVIAANASGGHAVRTNDDVVQTPTDPRYIGTDLWRVVSTETQDASQTATDELDLALLEGDTISWRVEADFANILWPYTTTGTNAQAQGFTVLNAASVNLGVGWTFAVDTVTVDIDCASKVPRAIVTYTAVLEQSMDGIEQRREEQNLVNLVVAVAGTAPRTGDQHGAPNIGHAAGTNANIGFYLNRSHFNTDRMRSPS